MDHRRLVRVQEGHARREPARELQPHRPRLAVARRGEPSALGGTGRIGRASRAGFHDKRGAVQLSNQRPRPRAGELRLERRRERAARAQLRRDEEARGGGVARPRVDPAHVGVRRELELLAVESGRSSTFGADQPGPLRAFKMLRLRSGVQTSGPSHQMVQGGRWVDVLWQGSRHFQPARAPLRALV